MNNVKNNMVRELSDHVIKYILLFIAGAFGYGAMEIIWRGYTHYSMLTAGGIVLCVTYAIIRHNEKAPLVLKATAVTLFIITLELIFGLIFNLMLGQRVWDYSDKPFNYFGQICLPYSFLWLLISFVLCVVIEKCITPPKSANVLKNK